MLFDLFVVGTHLSYVGAFLPHNPLGPGGAGDAGDDGEDREAGGVKARSDDGPRDARDRPRAREGFAPPVGVGRAFRGDLFRLVRAKGLECQRGRSDEDGHNGVARGRRA